MPLDRVNCNICGGADEKLLFLKHGFRIVKCNSCGLIFVNPRPGKEYLQELYSEEYYRISAKGSIGYRDYAADKHYHSANFRKLLSTIKKYKEEKGRLLDVGCALGFFLEEAKRRGWDVYGTELSVYAWNKAKEKGLNVFGGDIVAAGFENKFFDVVTCLGTIEHLPNPVAAIRKIYMILKDNGLFVLSTPDAGDLIGGRRFQYKPKEHLYYFTKGTIENVFEKEGFKILLIKKEWVKKPVYFIIERLGYYFPSSKGFTRGIETMFKRLGILNAGIRIPTGQMIVYAKKMSNR
ncbi:MAG: methyltransferase domain-containing protein [Deltaproteobacteria bacterium]|nr:methyltransferase domain-containing protein [Deltaproteobacteria bacterium]